jgi:hypothetical protein
LSKSEQILLLRLPESTRQSETGPSSSNGLEGGSNLAGDGNNNNNNNNKNSDNNNNNKQKH